MIRKTLLALAAVIMLVPAAAQTIENLTTEYMDCPLGIDVKQPVFGWQMKSKSYGAAQKAYRIVMAASAEDLAKGNYLYDTGTVNYSRSVNIKYNGKKLAPFTRNF